VILAATIALGLQAANAALLLPPWPLSPDGESIAVLGDAPLVAEGARVEREVGRLWRVVPEPGREAVLLSAGADSVRAAVAPPPGRILVTIDPVHPVKGKDRAVRIRLEVRGEGGVALALEAPPRVVVSTGRIGPFAASGDAGRFEGVWEPSDSAEPEVLGIVALAPRCPLCASPLAAGADRFPVSAAIDLPGRSDPGVETRVEIAGRSFGPVRADGNGRFVVPVVVPPGTRWATATSQSEIGNERKTKLDLQLPESPALFCALWPERVPADGRTEAGVRCVAWSASGAPQDPASLRAAAGAGTIRELVGVEGDGWQARYRPPARGAGADRITIQQAASPSVKFELGVGLAAGAPAAIDWRIEVEPALPGSRVPAAAHVRDERGDAIGEAVSSDGSLVGGLLRIRNELGDGRQRVPLAYSLPPGGSPAALHLRREGAQWVAAARDADARPVAGVELRFGGGAMAVTDARGEARVRGGSEVESVTGPGGLRAAAWAAAPSAALPTSVAREVRVALRPPGSIDVDVSVLGGWIRWTIRGGDGTKLAGRAVEVSAQGAELGPIERDGDGGRCRILKGTGTVAVTDAASGASALLEVR
jgi:hypothetical protein